MEAEASDVVYSIQSKRKGGFFEQITGRFFCRVFRLLTGIAQPNEITTARLMSRRYVSALLLHRESELNIGGLWIVAGFKQCHQTVQKHSISPMTCSLSRKFSHLVNAVTSFSSILLVFAFYTGLFISVSALAYIVFLTIRYFSPCITTRWLPVHYCFDMVFLRIAPFLHRLAGIYISKVFSEVKQRPFII